MDTIPRQLKLWTVEQYEHLAETGVFLPDERVELIEGMIVTVPPQRPPHAGVIRRNTHTLVQRYGKTHYVGVQVPLNTGALSQPEPDFCLTRKDVVDGEASHPSSADLVIEVSDSSLDYDRKVKARIYAAGGIPEYWILNLQDRLVEIHRVPIQTATGWEYSTRFVAKPGERVAPLFAPEGQLEVADLF